MIIYFLILFIVIVLLLILKKKEQFLYTSDNSYTQHLQPYIKNKSKLISRLRTIEKKFNLYAGY